MAPISIEFIFPLITVIISLLFFLSVTEQYFRKQKLHQLVWAISMFLFMVTAGAEALSLFLGYWDPFVYIIYYVLASSQVAIMGCGALYLFASRDIINERNSGKAIVLFGITWTFFAFLFLMIYNASIFLWIFLPAFVITLVGVGYWIQIRLKSPEKAFKISGMQFSHLFIIFTLYIFGLMLITALNAQLDIAYLMDSGGQEVAGKGWITDIAGSDRATTRLFSPLNTVPGSIALIGGAFYSYFTWQRSIRKNTGSYDLSIGFFNIYIGVGALVLASAGTLSGFGFGVLYLGEAVGVVLMYFGFLESDKITWKKLVNVLTLSWIRNRKESLSTAVETE